MSIEQIVEIGPVWDGKTAKWDSPDTPSPNVFLFLE